MVRFWKKINDDKKRTWNVVHISYAFSNYLRFTVCIYIQVRIRSRLLGAVGSAGPPECTGKREVPCAHRFPTLRIPNCFSCWNIKIDNRWMDGWMDSWMTGWQHSHSSWMLNLIKSSSTAACFSSPIRVWNCIRAKNENLVRVELLLIDELLRIFVSKNFITSGEVDWRSECPFQLEQNHLMSCYV